MVYFLNRNRTRQNRMKGNSGGVVANVLDCDIVVNGFKLQSRYYVHFWFNTLRKSMKLSATDWIIPLMFFYKDSVDIK